MEQVANSSLTTEEQVMTKVFVFKMDDGEEYSVLAKSFAQACTIFDKFGLDGRDILEMREYEARVREAE